MEKERVVKEVLDKVFAEKRADNKIKRVEVIDENGRSYVNWSENNFVSMSVQDEGRTLKVFITKK